jgi:hypothetical protein
MPHILGIIAILDGVRSPEVNRHNLSGPVTTKLITTTVPDEQNENTRQDTETETSGKTNNHY